MYDKSSIQHQHPRAIPYPSTKPRHAKSKPPVPIHQTSISPRISPHNMHPMSQSPDHIPVFYPRTNDVTPTLPLRQTNQAPTYIHIYKTALSSRYKYQYKYKYTSTARYLPTYKRRHNHYSSPYIRTLHPPPSPNQPPTSSIRGFHLCALNRAASKILIKVVKVRVVIYAVSIAII